MKFDVTVPISPKQLRNVLQNLGLNQSELARMLDVDGRTVRRWIKGESPVPGPVCVALHSLERLHDLRQLLNNRSDVR